jgi:hypothetical protein
MIGPNCTLWFDRLWGVDFGHCCAAHDFAYLSGANRLLADAELAKCVAEAGLPFTGFLMGGATTALGWLFYKRQKRRSGKSVAKMVRSRNEEDT